MRGSDWELAYFQECLRSAQLVYFGGVGIVCAALIRWVGGLIDLIGQLEIVAFTGGRGIGAVGSLAWTAWGSRRRWLDGQRRYHGWWDGGVATDCAS